METKANYALIGAFVLMAAVAVMGFVLWLGQAQFRQSFDEYDIVFEGPVALEDGAAVRYIGVKVGEVEWVRIDRADPSKVRARVRIDAKTPVKTDSTAVIDFAGITGVTFVQINAGSPDADALTREAGEPVPVILADRTQLAEIVSSGRELVAEASVTLERLNAVLTEENIERFSNSLENIERITAGLADDEGMVDTVNATLSAIEGAANSFDEASRALGAFGQQAEGQVAAFGQSMEATLADARAALTDLEALMGDAGKTVRAATTAIEGPATRVLEDADLLGQDLRALVSRIDRLARELQQNPQSLVVGQPRPYEEN